MNTKQKIERLVAREPDLKETLLSLEDKEEREVFHKIVKLENHKLIIIGKGSEKYSKLYQLAQLLNRGYIRILKVNTAQLLDYYVEEETSLTEVKSDLVVIRDGRAYVPNKQKSNMVMQVFEQNTDCIYYYIGSNRSFTDEHQSLLEYARDNGIKVVSVKEKREESTEV